MTTIMKASPIDAGCWIDGHWGQYGPSRLIEIAQVWGMVLSLEDRVLVAAYVNDTPEGYAFEAVVGQGGLADEAEEWMNENVAPEGYAFGWEDGEFFLWHEDTWSQA